MAGADDVDRLKDLRDTVLMRLDDMERILYEYPQAYEVAEKGWIADIQKALKLSFNVTIWNIEGKE